MSPTVLGPGYIEEREHRPEVRNLLRQGPGATWSRICDYRAVAGRRLSSFRAYWRRVRYTIFVQRQAKQEKSFLLNVTVGKDEGSSGAQTSTVGSRGRRCWDRHRRLLGARLDARQHCRQDGKRAGRSRGRCRSHPNLRRKIRSAGRRLEKAGPIQSGRHIVGPEFIYREWRLGDHARERHAQLGRSPRMCGETRQPKLAPPSPNRSACLAAATQAAPRQPNRG